MVGLGATNTSQLIIVTHRPSTHSGREMRHFNPSFSSRENDDQWLGWIVICYNPTNLFKMDDLGAIPHPLAMTNSLLLNTAHWNSWFPQHSQVLKPLPTSSPNWFSPNWFLISPLGELQKHITRRPGRKCWKIACVQCVCVYIYIYIYVYIHTHVYIYIYCTYMSL